MYLRHFEGSVLKPRLFQLSFSSVFVAGNKSNLELKHFIEEVIKFASTNPVSVISYLWVSYNIHVKTWSLQSFGHNFLIGGIISCYSNNYINMIRVKGCLIEFESIAYSGSIYSCKIFLAWTFRILKVMTTQSQTNLNCSLIIKLEGRGIQILLSILKLKSC